MILYKKVRYKNFLAVGNYWIEIDLVKYPETLIFGANGSGKSHILDAVCYGLFGKTYRNINKPTYVNSYNGKNMEVQIEFSIGTVEYRIERGLKPNIFNIIKNGVLLNQDSRNIDYQDVLEKQILNLTFKAFCQVVILGSARYVPFMELKAAERRGIIEDILDIEIFSKMNEINKKNISKNEDDLRNNSYDLKMVDDRIKLQAKHIKEMLENTQEIIGRKSTEISSYENGIISETEIYRALSEDKAKLTETIKNKAKLEKTLRDCASFDTQFKTKISKLSKEVDFYEHSENCPTCKQMIETSFKEKVVKEKKEEIEKTEKILLELNGKIKRTKERLSDIYSTESKINAINIDISVATANIASMKNQIQNLNEEINELRLKVKDKNEISVSFKEEKDQLLNEKKTLLERQETLRHAVVLLKDNGIKSKIIKQYIPVINAYINKYLSVLDLPVQFELNETFNETIKSRFKTEFSYNNFSQGQKLRIDLAIMFTWRDIAKMRNSASTNLLIMDEIFDSSLDNNGTEELMRLLKGLTNGTNLFIISHNDELKDKFDNQIQFELKKDYSYIV